MQRTTLPVAFAAGLAAVVLAVAAPLSASAHVRVDPQQAAPGSYAVLTFRVPTESATAGTVKLEVDFPTDQPFSNVDYQAVPGWTTQVVTSKLPKPVKITGATLTEAVTKVIWTANPGTEIGVGQFGQFAVEAGPVPSTGSVMLPAHQTYSDGSVVNWDQATPASGVEPQHPAPVLYINDPLPAAATAAPHAPAVVASTAAPGTTTRAEDPATATANVSLILGIVGIALGVVAILIAVFAATRRRTPGSSSGSRP